MAQEPTIPSNSQKSEKRNHRGSGSDVNSDSSRLGDHDNLLDKIDEDSFPASDPPSHTPVTGTARKGNADPSGLPRDFKNNKAEQFEYGRKSEESTLHFDRSSKRLRTGNPDIGEVDLGTIEAEHPAQAADDDDVISEP